MDRIRIGNDIDIYWNIFVKQGDEDVAYDLTGRDLKLYVCSMYSMDAVEGFVTEGNQLRFTYKGKDQEHAGKYSLLLVENEGKDGMYTLDESNAFCLVKCSCNAGSEPVGNVGAATINLNSRMFLGAAFYDDTELWNALDEKVDKERGKQLSQEDFTSVLKAKLLSIESEAQKNAPVDDTLSNTSTNAIQNKAVKNYLDAADAEIKTLKEQMSKKADAEQINTINGQSMIGGKNITIDVANMTETTYQSLKAMRDAKKLKAGSYYRITDYITKTEADGTLAAGHPFDVIVLALSEDTLSEQAYAIQSKRDTAGYFASCRLDAWRLSYALDNDDVRFNWAAPDGTGVIYRMIDEWCNDIPYDFKNIMFVKNGMKQYTFGSAVATSEHPEDNSLMGFSFGNSVQHFHEENDINGYSFTRVTFGEYCMYNTVGHGSGEVTFGSECISNTIGIACNNITLGNRSHDNVFSDACLSITLGANCSYNVFERACSSISLGDSCSYNKYGAGCNKVYVGISAVEDRPYTTNVEFASRVANVRLMRTATASQNDKVQNIVVKRGVSGGTIIVPANNEYELILGRNSAGEVKMYTVEDLIG